MCHTSTFTCALHTYIHDMYTAEQFGTLHSDQLLLQQVVAAVAQQQQQQQQQQQLDDEEELEEQVNPALLGLQVQIHVHS